MSISLTKKNQTISLTKAAPKLKQAIIGLGWDVDEHGTSFDLDASLFLTDDTQQVLVDATDFIFYGNLSLVENGTTLVEHTGDNRTGAGDGDDEQIIINLEQLPARYTQAFVAVTIYDSKNRRQNFGMVDNAFIRIIDKNTSEEVVKYELNEAFSSEDSVVFASLIRESNGWSFKTLATPIDGGLAGVCKYFGVDAE